jgi:hypothetical protein
MRKNLDFKVRFRKLLVLLVSHAIGVWNLIVLDDEAQVEL